MEITIRDEFIKLGQALKLAGVVDDGVEAKHVIQEGLVKVNGETDQRRGGAGVVAGVMSFMWGGEKMNKKKIDSLTV